MKVSDESDDMSEMRRKTTLSNAFAKYSFEFEWGMGVI
jgi:hypothetical protein